MNAVKWCKQNLKFIVAVVLAVAAAVLITLHFTASNVNQSQEKLNAAKTVIGKLMILPNDEEPTLATVTDKNQLNDPFLAAKAQNGDEILVYAKNQMVIIYRPSKNRIVTVGTLSVDPALQEAQSTSLTVVDGTGDPAKTKKVIAEIKAAYPDIKVIDGGKISRQDFTNTVVIDNTNQRDNLVLALVKVISGKRGIVPLGVDKVPTDMMIIVGADK